MLVASGGSFGVSFRTMMRTARPSRTPLRTSPWTVRVGSKTARAARRRMAWKVCGKLPHVTQTFTAVYEPAEEGGYAAFVEEVPGAISQGETLEEARENLKEALELMLEVNRERVLDGVDESRIVREPIAVSR